MKASLAVVAVYSGQKWDQITPLVQAITRVCDGARGQFSSTSVKENVRELMEDYENRPAERMQLFHKVLTVLQGNPGTSTERLDWLRCTTETFGRLSPTVLTPAERRLLEANLESVQWDYMSYIWSIDDEFTYGGAPHIIAPFILLNPGAVRRWEEEVKLPREYWQCDVLNLEALSPDRALARIEADLVAARYNRSSTDDGQLREYLRDALCRWEYQDAILIVDAAECNRTSLRHVIDDYRKVSGLRGGATWVRWLLNTLTMASVIRRPGIIVIDLN